MLNLIDPIELAKKTENVVCRGNKRKYLRFGTTPDYKTGVATGYAVGCNLRCVFCWAHETRDNNELVRDFYSPREVFDILHEIIGRNPKIDKIRISDGEPTLCRDHLMELIEITEKSDVGQFVLETNGILFGYDENYVKDLSAFKKIYVRLDLKAGTPEAFSKKTGAIPEAYEYPFQAIRHLMKYGINFGVAAMSADPRFMDPLERVGLITRVGEIDPALVLRLEEEMTVLVPTAKKRLNAYGWKAGKVKYPFYVIGPLRKYVQVSYMPIKSLKKQKVNFGFLLKNLIQLKHGI
ncbi:MAG TPA: radical SAM protein [Bacteroidetes bacterium]|nr:radical SAM protein [Bacteroidota bacterium]